MASGILVSLDQSCPIFPTKLPNDTYGCPLQPTPESAFSSQVDVDADGVVNPAQFLTLAKRTLGQTMQHETKLSTDENRSPTAPERIRDHRHATTPAKGRPNGASQQAAAAAARLLRSADPHGFGVITFSQCVRYLTVSSA